MTGQSVDAPRKRGRPPGQPRTGGRAKGTPNKATALLKDAVLRAAEIAGGSGGLVAYLTEQAQLNPGPFMSLLGKILPMQVEGPGPNGEHHLINQIILMGPDDTGNPEDTA